MIHIKSKKMLNNFNNEPVQLELPFSQPSYKNESFYYDDNFINQTFNEEFLEWFNPSIPIPSAKWDKRNLKKFIAEVWVIGFDEQVVECFAVSKAVARNFLNKDFSVFEVHELPDFPTDFINSQIRSNYYLNKSLDEELKSV